MLPSKSLNCWLQKKKKDKQKMMFDISGLQEYKLLEKKIKQKNDVWHS